MTKRIRYNIMSALLAILLMSCLYVAGKPALVYADTVTSPTMTSRVTDGLAVLSQSLEDTGLTLIWSKPDNYQEISDYNVYKNGVKIGNSNNNINSPAQKFFNRFYDDSANTDDVKVSMHNYVVSGLTPNTAYTFTIKAVDKNGNEIDEGTKYSISVTTNLAPTIIDVSQAPYNAAGDGVTVNTAAIQNAINDCPSGGEVLIPAGKTFVSGALYLKSNMTFRVDGTLLSSSSADDMLGSSSLVVSGSLQRRFPGTVNVIGTSTVPLTNVRLTGTGTINGNGWVYQTSNPYDLEYGNGDLTESAPSRTGTISTNGILAKSEYDKALQVYKNFYTSAGKSYTESDAQAYAYGSRSCMINGTHVKNMYIGDGLTVTNPANHTIYMTQVQNYVVNGVIAQSFNINNGDGINVSYFNGLTVVNCVINTGDDNIAMNGGAVGDPVVGSAWIFDNYMERGHGGVTFGSGTCSWIDNVLAEDNVMVQTANGLRMKSKPSAGGGVRFVTFRDTAMKHLTGAYNSTGPVTNWDGTAFTFTTNYAGVAGSYDWPVYHDINVSNCSVNGAKAISNDGYHDAGTNFSPSYNLNFNNITFKNISAEPSITYLNNSTFQNCFFDKTPLGWLNTDFSNCSGITIATLLTQNDTLTAISGKAKTGSVANDITSSNTGTLFYSVVKQPANGKVTFSADGTYVYTPNVGFTGSDSFDYKVSNKVTTSSLLQDSNISTISITVQAVSAISSIEAESYSSMSGVKAETCSEGGQDIGYIENGDYIEFDNVDFGTGVNSFTARVASGSSGGNIEIRLDSPTGILIGTCPVAGTGSWQTWTTDSCSVSGAKGVHNLYLKFTGSSGYLMNINWFKFKANDAFSTIEAESYSSMSGVNAETCSEGGQDIGYIENGDYIEFDNVDFGTGVKSFAARVASGTAGGNIEIRLDSPTGTLLGTCPVVGTGGWQTWTTDSCSVSGAKGVHNLYLKFTGSSGYLMNINWFKFKANDAFSTIEAESYSSMSGVNAETCSEGGQDIGYIENGDYIEFDNVDFGTGVKNFAARVASGNAGGNIEIRLDSPTGILLGTCPVTGTGGWQTWVTQSCSVSGASGIHNLYLKFTGNSGYMLNLNWIKFGS